MGVTKTTDWRIVTTEPYDTCTGAVTFETDFETCHIKASTKWDGCTNIWITDKPGTGEEEKCYHHVCDLDTLIVALQDVREKARSYFYGDFCVGTINEDEVKQKIVEFQQQETEYKQSPSGLLLPKVVNE